jgi:hypothetical protein
MLEFYQDGKSQMEEINMLSIVSSLLQLFYFQITEMFSLICALTPLCQIAIMFMCFLVNSMCDVMQAKGAYDTLMKLLTFVLQTAVLLALMALFAKCLLGVVFGLVGATMANFIKIFKYF